MIGPRLLDLRVTRFARDGVLARTAANDGPIGRMIRLVRVPVADDHLPGIAAWLSRKVLP